MARIAILDERNGMVSVFQDERYPVPDGKRVLPVVEEKPDAVEGFTLIGPDYRIEKDRVVEFYHNEPVDPLSPQELDRRLRAVEAYIATTAK